MSTPTSGDNVNVRVGGDVSGLEAAMKQGARAVETGREHIGESLEGMSVVTERAAKKMEHLSIQMTFAANALAEGSERGVTRAAHGLAALGFVFGPAVGVVTTAAAIATERIVEFFHKAAEEAKKAREAFDAEIAKMGNAGDAAGLKQKARDLWSGTPFDEKGHLRNPSRGVPGAFEGSLQDLRARKAFLERQQEDLKNVAMKDGIFLPGLQIAKALKELEPQLEQAEEEFKRIQDALDVMRDRPADTGILPMKSTAKKPLTDEELAANQKWLDDYYDAQTTGMLKVWEETQKIAREQGKKYEQAVLDTHFEVGKSSGALTAQAVNDLQKIAERNAKVFKEIGDAGKGYIKETEDKWMAAFSGITDAWNRTVERMRSGQDSLKNFWKDLWHEMVRGAIEGFLRVKEAKAAHWLAINAMDLKGNAKSIALSLASAIAKIAHYAAVAAAAAWSAIAGIPYVGPFLAPAVAAAALAGVLALAGGIGGGGGGGGAGGGASAASLGGTTNNYHMSVSTLDSQSFDRFAMGNAATFARAAAAGASQGVRLPGTPGRG